MTRRAHSPTRSARARCGSQRELERRVAEAIEAGDLPPDADPVDLAFAFRALVTGAIQASRQRGDAEAGARFERAARRQLGVPAAA